MFIHWGLYSVIGQHEWAKEVEGIPLAQYELFAKHFKPKPNAARDWARLAKRAGQKYMVMTTKHHEGFCHWDSKLTDYNAAKQGPGRDLVREFVDAARAEGLRVGFYYSLMDWHHPDGATCKTDPAARKRFVDYTHGLIRELMTNYGKIDMLWYDVDWPLTAAEWESERMNEMVFELQPEIIVNNRNGLDGDFSTPEQEIAAPPRGRAWETCMTLNDSWGFNRGDDAWKTPKDDCRPTWPTAPAAAAIICSTSAPNPTAPSRKRPSPCSKRRQMARHQRQGHLRHRARPLRAGTPTPTTPAAATRSTSTSNTGPATPRRPTASASSSPKQSSPSAASSPKSLSARLLKTGERSPSHRTNSPPPHRPAAESPRPARHGNRSRVRRRARNRPHRHTPPLAEAESRHQLVAPRLNRPPTPHPQSAPPPPRPHACTRTIDAPCRIAATIAARLAVSRASTGASVPPYSGASVRPRNDFRLTPASSGLPSSSSSCLPRQQRIVLLESLAESVAGIEHN